MLSITRFLNSVRSIGLPDFRLPWKNIIYFQSQAHSTIKKIEQSFNQQLPVEIALTPPTFWYTDPSVLNYEKNAIFMKNWLAVSRCDQVASHGQYTSGTIFDEPYLLVRGEDKVLHGFFNICRHHATILTDSSSGTTSQFECPYHGWTYNLEGRLTKATRLRGIKNFVAKDFGLKPIAVRTWGPMVFMCLDDSTHSNSGTNATETNGWMPQLEVMLNSMKNMSPMSDMKHVRSTSYSINCNWKVFIDNYLDGGYHIPYAHKELSSSLDGKTYALKQYDGFSVQSSSGKGEGRIGSEVLYAHVFPNLLINRYGPWLDFNIVKPTGPETCDVDFEWFLDQSVISSMNTENLDRKINADIAQGETVQDEDIWLCERVQKGLRSRSYTVGRYAPRVEYLMHNFHLKLYEELINYSEH